MNALKRIGRILYATMLCATASVLAAAPDEDCGERVSLAGLIANPDGYHGKALWVVANVTIDFENMTACPSENETQMEGCLWLNIDDGPYKTEQDYARYQSKSRTWNRFNLQTVAIRATFDKTLNGHFSMWPAGLGNVTEVSGNQDGWSFTANAAVPRTACVGALPVTEESSRRWFRIGSLKLRNGDYNGDYDGAIADFTRAIELEPGNSGYYLMRGNAKRKKRDYTGAIVDYTRAIEFNPKFADAYRSRGLVKQKMGDPRGAAADLARANQFAPAQ